jgi:DNA ligase-1
MLAPNDKTDINTILYPIYGSFKMDGIRCLFIGGEMLSRSFKPIRNKVLQEKFKPLKEFSKTYNTILDGEIYKHGASFQEITSWVMTTSKSVPEDLKFWCFDAVRNTNTGARTTESFEKRLAYIPDIYEALLVRVEQQVLNTAHDVQNMFEEALEKGYEGLILKAPGGYYKNGRGTLGEGLIYKVKPFETFDGEIVEVIQSTVVDSNAEKSLDNFGYSKTSKKIGDRVLIEKASAFRVKYEKETVKVTLAMTDKEKEEVWKNQKTYIGRYISFKGMLVGAKDVPRHPVFLRFRDDLDGKI